MKKIFSISTGLVLYACMGINAQVVNRDLHQAGKFTVYKKTDSGNASRVSVRVAPEVIRNFLKRFGEVPNEKWFDVGSGFVAMFHLDDMDYQVAFDKKGNWLRTIRSSGHETSDSYGGVPRLTRGIESPAVGRTPVG